MNNHRKQNSKRRQGAVMVEFAIVAPLLFLLFVAAFEFCRANMIRHTADNAVYEAARVGILPGATTDEVQLEARRILGSLGLTGVDVRVKPGKIDDDTEKVTVRVEVPLDENTFITSKFLTGKTIKRQLTMVREGAGRK